jgi:hypothetical protein
MHKSKYSRYLNDGSDNPASQNTVTMLSALLGDNSQPTEDRARAAEILKWSIERAKTLDPDVASFSNELDCSSLWEWPESFQLQDVVGKDGVVRRECVCIGSTYVVPVKSAAQSAPVTEESEI